MVLEVLKAILSFKWIAGAPKKRTAKYVRPFDKPTKWRGNGKTRRK